ncbi:putative protein kinase RLK-Pelle-SD-2b family [Helianthus annuus]|nr:putative protein kinase RLK-Pelle-SD-2b family [Helianthus annuus]KAJ0591703.1 putative protein kinase RLK-Pelle-SD-2b family [Helianthus annuus]KAJ0766692.1 putative protein kinase RLK-Pelle-SD-2b family [Helianthus annuus]KAJ0772587.1 putative protein kinase RLK-Pelle-SD-2b family [Helianthus annuus]KAJ0942049.1 putative protein kinase RLK-Pelle-SD-2b family [Helianthus annuus]
MSFSDEDIAHLRIPLKYIASATNNFAEENLLKRGGKADVYKGVLLLRSKGRIYVVIRKYRCSTLTFDFYAEINRISHVKHSNVVRLIGFCDEEDERMLVIEHVVKGSLDKYLSDPTLTWSQKLLICCDAAKCLKSSREYNYIKCFSPKSFKIFLDKDMRAKVLFYIDSSSDPKNAFGMILLEVLYGRKVTMEDANQFQDKLAKNRYEKEELSIFSGIDYASFNTESLYVFSQVAFDYLMGGLDFDSVELDRAHAIQWKHENPVSTFSVSIDIQPSFSLRRLSFFLLCF